MEQNAEQYERGNGDQQHGPGEPFETPQTPEETQKTGAHGSTLLNLASGAGDDHEATQARTVQTSPAGFASSGTLHEFAYLVLFVLVLLAAALIVDSRLLAKEVSHPASITDYLALGWLAASIATVVGAIGSGLDGIDAVRDAAYGHNQRRRSSSPAEASEDG